LKKIHLIFSFFPYLIRSTNAHGIHSPFVYQLYTEVISKKNKLHQLEEVNVLKRKLLKNQKELNIIDLGAGSLTTKSNKRSISEIARTSVKSKKYAKLLFRLIQHLKPKSVIELGTSLGLTTAYLAVANKDSEIISIEGCPEIAALAKQNLRALNIQDVDIITGNFDDQFIPALTKLKKVDFIFFDGNHRKEPTVKYFIQSLPFLNENALLVFDDIHWSADMEEAWELIKNHPQATVTIDLFFMGLVFIKPGQVKENFILRF